MRSLGRVLAFALWAAALAAALPGQAEGRPNRGSTSRRPTPPRAAEAKRASSKKAAKGCKKEKALSFLVRKNFMKGGQLKPAVHQRALKFRAQHYGWVEGANLEAYAEHSAISQAAETTFFGLPIRVHKKIVPKLRCVERTIRANCNGKGKRYVPKAIGGFREANTYRGGEVSNHMFGIAIDIDPDRNPCCGCVDPWPSHRYCQGGAKSVYEKTELTQCWIDSFEQHGFHWLGHDSLEDTMHFEYLGNPDR